MLASEEERVSLSADFQLRHCRCSSVSRATATTTPFLPPLHSSHEFRGSQGCWSRLSAGVSMEMVECLFSVLRSVSRATCCVVLLSVHVHDRKRLPQPCSRAFCPHCDGCAARLSAGFPRNSHALDEPNAQSDRGVLGDNDVDWQAAQCVSDVLAVVCICQSRAHLTFVPLQRTTTVHSYSVSLKKYDLVEQCAMKRLCRA